MPFNWSKNTVVRQSLGLFGSGLAVIAIGFFIKYIQTHGLGDFLYGEYAFFITIATFLVLFFKWGYFTTIRVLLAQNHNPIREKKLLGTGVVISLVLGILFCGTLWGLGFVVNDWFNTQIGSVLSLLSPFTIIYVFDALIDAYGTGTNKIKMLSWYKLIPKLFYLLILGYIWYYGGLNLEKAIRYNLLMSAIYILSMIIWLKPSFKDLKKNFGIIQLKNKKFGIHEYTGSLLGQSTYMLDQLFISYFVNTTQLGFYSLAYLICAPMTMMSQAITQSLFRRFAGMNAIPKKVFQYNLMWLLGCMVFLYFVSPFLVDFLFGQGFEQVAEYIVPLSIAFFFHGLYTPYFFLEAKSQGKYIRNTKAIEAVVNVVGNIIFIPIYGVYGAIWVSIAAKLVHWLLFRYYYQQFIKAQANS